MNDMSTYEIVTRRAAVAIAQIESMIETLKAYRDMPPINGTYSLDTVEMTLREADSALVSIRRMLAADADSEEVADWLGTMVVSTIRLHAFLLRDLALG